MYTRPNNLVDRLVDNAVAKGGSDNLALFWVAYVKCSVRGPLVGVAEQLVSYSKDVSRQMQQEFLIALAFSLARATVI
jgi:hypothetical protein